MKIKTLVAVLLLSGGVTSTFAQTENRNSNSSISHEAVRAGNFKYAYAPCIAVLKDCPSSVREHRCSPCEQYTAADGKRRRSSSVMDFAAFSKESLMYFIPLLSPGINNPIISLSFI